MSKIKIASCYKRLATMVYLYRTTSLTERFHTFFTHIQILNRRYDLSDKIIQYIYVLRSIYLFFHLIYSLPIVLSLPPWSDVAQIRRHEAGPSPPSLLRRVPSVLNARKNQQLLASSTRVELYTGSASNVLRIKNRPIRQVPKSRNRPKYKQLRGSNLQRNVVGRSSVSTFFFVFSQNFLSNLFASGPTTTYI